MPYTMGARTSVTNSSEEIDMTPTTYRPAGAAIHVAVAECSLGALLVAASERGVCAIFLGDNARAVERELRDRFPGATLVAGDAAFERLVNQVVALVETPGLGLELPLDARGTEFQRRVWRALRE